MTDTNLQDSTSSPTPHPAPPTGVPLVTMLPGAAQPAFPLALIVEGLLEGTVDLLDARELETAQFAAIGEHNRVFTADGRERIVCIVSRPGAEGPNAIPQPIPNFFGQGALSLDLSLLQAIRPDWTLSLRTIRVQPMAIDSDPAPQLVAGWLVEIGQLDEPMAMVAPNVGGFNPSPEMALFIAALAMAEAQDSQPLANAKARLNLLFDGVQASTTVTRHW